MTFDELVVALKTQQDMASSLKVTIDKLKRQILETKEAQDGIAPIEMKVGRGRWTTSPSKSNAHTDGMGCFAYLLLSTGG